MTIKQARGLNPGDKVKQKIHGYIMTVETIEDSRNLLTTNEFVNVFCETDSGSLMRHNHKDLLLLENS